MREHLRKALLETRNHLLKIKAGKYNEEEERAQSRPNPAPAPDSSGDRPSVKPEVPKEPESDLEFEKEKVEFFRRKRPKAREAVAGAVKR